MRVFTLDKPDRFVVLNLPCTGIYGFAASRVEAEGKLLPNTFVHELTDDELLKLKEEL